MTLSNSGYHLELKVTLKIQQYYLELSPLLSDVQCVGTSSANPLLYYPACLCSGTWLN